MAIAPEVAEHYEANRLRMATMNRRFRIYMWSSIILGALIFSTAFFAGALSTVKENQEGANIFYHAMSAGVFQVLLGLATIVLSWLTAMKSRMPSLILLGINVLGLLMILLRKNGTFTGANIIFLVVGIGLNIWAQMLCNENEDLKTEPGYPLFSVQADYRAHYELPADVRARQQQASTQMSEIGRAAVQPAAAAAKPVSGAETQIPSAFAPNPNLFFDPAPVKLPPEVRLSSETEQTLGISEMTGSSRQFVPQAEALAAPTDVSLDSLASQTPQINEAALPQIDPSAMLADMTAIPSHATVKGNPDMLPTPEEVKARLAAMKRARAEHHPEE